MSAFTQLFLENPAAVKQYSFMDNFFTVSAMVISATTNFWLAMMLLILFAHKLHWFPATWTQGGGPEHVVVTRHILRNSLMPIITVAGLTAGTMMASTVVVESVFSTSGLGNLILTAVKAERRSFGYGLYDYLWPHFCHHHINY